jgi:hypothetical protein
MAFNLLSNGGGALRDGCGVGATGPFRHACRERDKQPPQRRGGGPEQAMPSGLPSMDCLICGAEQNDAGPELTA